MSSHTILVCNGTGCIANGAKLVTQALEVAVAAAGADAKIETYLKCTGCHGLCESGPMVKIKPDDIAYYKVHPWHAVKIVQALGKDPVMSLLYRDEDKKCWPHLNDNPFFAKQVKVALRNVGEIDPLVIEDYLSRDGYQALTKIITEKTPPDVLIQEVIDSRLRGRGGAGFPTGRKWKSAAAYQSYPKYVICNGDEGDPGAFMDGYIMEGDPHSVIEGMIIAAYAIGAQRGYLYIRDEYIFAQKNMKEALTQAKAHGYLGNNILGSDLSFELTIMSGGGAFVCGESTALIASIEGRAGEPRAKYIRSAERGLWGQPTLLNNVETLANIPPIILHGGAKFSELGTERSGGTKAFSLVGKVNRTGLVEVAMGTTLRELIFEIGGGVKGGRDFKAVQTGGPSGGCIPLELIDLQVDFDSLIKQGAMMGSGGMIVMDEFDCMVEVARYYVHFLAEESCGKCTPCREGLRHMLSILTDITEGRGQQGDIEVLQVLCDTMLDASLCALGKSAPNPVLSTIRHFRHEYDAHINEHRCPAGVCTELTTFSIDPENCTRCKACKKACPVGAVMGDAHTPYSIAAEACIACGACRDVCRFDSVYSVKRQS